MNRLFLHTIMLTGSILISRVLNFGFRYLAARALDVEAYGRAALALAIIQYAAVLGTFNLGQAVARFVAAEEPAERPALLGALRWPAAGFAALAGAAGAALALFLPKSAGLAAWVAAGAVPWVLMNYGEGVLRGLERVPQQAFNQVLVAGSRLLAGILALGFFGWASVQSVVGCFVFGLVCGSVFVALQAARFTAGMLAAGGATPGQVRAVLGFGAWLTLAQLSTTGVAFGGRLILAREGAFAAVAHYDNALLLYTVAQTLLASYVMVSVPHYAGRDPRQPYGVVSFWKILAVFGAVYALALAPEALGWRDALFEAAGVGAYAPAYPVFLVVGLAFPAEAAFVQLSAVLQGRGAAAGLALLALAAGSVALGMVALLAPRLGPYGAAAGNVTCYVILAAGVPWLARRAGVMLRRV